MIQTIRTATQSVEAAAMAEQLNLFEIEAATEDSSATLAPCTRCNSTKGVIVPGAGPHWRGVRCLCDRFVKWLPKPWGEP